jgi:ribose transport system permease protein
MPSGTSTSVRRRLSDEVSLLLIFLVIVVAVSVFIPRFRTVYNALTVIRQFSIVTVVSLGETVVLIAGGFDLSVGAIAGMAGIFCAHMMVTLHWPVWLSVVLGVVIGSLSGLLNGLIVAKGKIQPLITTLAMSWIFNGVILVTTKGWPVTQMPSAFEFLGQGWIVGIPLPIIIMAAVAGALGLFLSQTRWGRYLYAIGSNEKASRLAGLPTDWLTVAVFVICGTLAAFAGIVLASRMGSAQANAGADWPLPAIAAAVIGGVSLAGGKGKIYGVLIGAALLGIINNILVLLHVSAYWQGLISGLIVLAAVSVDAARKAGETRRKARILQPDPEDAPAPPSSYTSFPTS